MTAVRFEHVSKAYDLHSGGRTLASAVKQITGSRSPDELFYALTDVSFEIKHGEAFGIIGKNGAGKSTILKIITGITRATTGRVEVNGRVSSLIELGAGFHPDLSGRENVYMSGAILGIPRKVMDKKFHEIVDFAELWDFIDVPVKKYSSGMYARLGFAVAVSVDPDILIIDEILSVGDIFFQQKCFARMHEIIKRGVTFIFVTHDPAALRNLCERALLVEGGKIEYDGGAAEAVSRYYGKLSVRPDRERASRSKGEETSLKVDRFVKQREDIGAHSILNNKTKRHGPRGIALLAARVTNKSGEDTLQVPMMEPLIFSLLLRANEHVIDPSAGIHLYDRMGNLVFAAGTRQLHRRLPDLKSCEELVVSFALTMSVEPGEYTFSLGCAEPSPEGPNLGFTHDEYDMLGPVVVVGDPNNISPFYGVAQLPMHITVESPEKG